MTLRNMIYILLSLSFTSFISRTFFINLCMNVIVQQIDRAFKDFIIAEHAMKFEKSSFKSFSDDEKITIASESRRNFMIIAFITNSMNDSIVNTNVINESSFSITKKFHAKENIINNSLDIIAQNSIHQNTMNIETKLKRRKILLKKIMNILENIIKKRRFETVLNNTTFDFKKLRLQDLSEKIKKRLEQEVLNSI